MKIILVRHGESIGNKKNIIQGQTDFKLSKKGREQAKKLALRFKKNKIDIIYSSDLNRAKETANIIRKFHKKTPIFFSELLRERNFGYLEGKIADKIDISEFRNKKPKGGETSLEVKKRARTFLNNLLKKYSNETILVVTHGGIIRMVYGIVNKKTIKQCYEKMPPGFLKNTCVFEIKTLPDGNLKLIRQNCIRHLNNKTL